MPMPHMVVLPAKLVPRCRSTFIFCLGTATEDAARSREPRETTMIRGMAVLALAVGMTAAAAATSDPKITMTQARKVALQRAHGKIESEELEREHGKLIYSFDIRVPNQSGITEVAGDAMKGTIVNVAHETPSQEA